MSLLTPLGLLGLLGIAALILIYILKPNYQQKIISSTYVWKLSLKYRKKRIPINRFRNILIFLCQILILALSATLLAQPFLMEERIDRNGEKIVIIDASASMLVSNGKTRFERAIEAVGTIAQDTISEGNIISVILADDDAHFLAQNCSTKESLTSLRAELSAAQCSYGSADVKGATELAEQVLLENPKAQVLFYTATTYIDTGAITVVNLSDEEEWNVAVLDASAQINDDNFYDFSVEVGYYGNTSEEIVVYCDIYGANGMENPVSVSKRILFSNFNEEQTILFTDDDFFYLLGTDGIYAYDYIHAYVSEADSLDEDNSFYYYGGAKQTLRVLYSSSEAHTGWSTAFLRLREVLKNRWDIDYKEHTIVKNNFITEGYDLYIFEHAMPEYLPTDGVVLLVDPDRAPEGSDFIVDGLVKLPSSDMTLASGTPHPLTERIEPSRITLYSYQRISAQVGYDELLYYAGDPVLMVKNTELSKVMILSLDLRNSNISVRPDFLYFLYNVFEYFLPSTISGYNYEIGDEVKLNSRAPFLELSGPETQIHFESFPSNVVLTKPGTYTLTQLSMTGEYVVENFYAHIPSVESNITKEVAALPSLVYESEKEYDDFDLLIYFASVLVALLFVEWWLQSREYF